MNDERKIPPDDRLDDLLKEAFRGEPDQGIRPSDEAILAYISGKATEEEKDEVREALADSASFRAELLELIDELESEAAEPRKSRHRLSGIQPYIAAAAILVVLAYPAYLGFQALLMPAIEIEPVGPVEPLVYFGLTQRSVGETADEAYNFRIKPNQRVLPILFGPAPPISPDERIRLVIKDSTGFHQCSLSLKGFELSEPLELQLGMMTVEVPVRLLPPGLYTIELLSEDRKDLSLMTPMYFRIQHLEDSGP